jgi:antitoxin ParD1/3/4
MSIELSPELEQLVQSKLTSGRYQTVSDVLTDALGLLEERDLYTVVHRDEIQKRIAQGYESLRAGRGVDGDAVFVKLRQGLASGLLSGKQVVEVDSSWVDGFASTEAYQRECDSLAGT